MSVTSQPMSLADLRTDLQNRVRVQTGVTATENQAARYINIALQDLHLGFDYKFPWAERAAKLQVRDQYSTGLVSITKGSAALTGTSTLWTTTDAFGIANVRAGGKMRIAGGITPYTVLSVGGTGSVTLDSPFTEATQSAQTYLYYEDEYALAADFMRPIDAQVFSDQCSIRLISRTEFRLRFPTNSVPGRPAVACIIDSAPSGNTTPVRKVRFNPPPATALTIPYTYITSYLATSATGVAQANLSADTDEPIVPLRYRHALVFNGLYHWYRDKRDDVRSQEARQEYTDVMIRIVSDTEVGAVRPSFAPRVGGYAMSARRPWGAGGGRRYVTGDRFDQMK